MSNRMDRQGARTPADLERKYNFEKSFAEVMGIATDARTSAEQTKVIVTKIAETNNGVVLKVTELEKQVDGALALEIVEEADGTKYSQLRSDVDKVKFTSDEVEISSDEFSLKDGKVVSKEGNVKTTVEKGNVTNEYIVVLDAETLNSKAILNDGALFLLRKYSDDSGFSKEREAVVGWQTSREEVTEEEGAKVYRIPFFLTAERMQIGSMKTYGGLYDTEGDLCGKEWRIYATGDTASLNNGNVTIYASEVKVVTPSGTFNLIAKLKELESRIAALE